MDAPKTIYVAPGFIERENLAVKVESDEAGYIRADIADELADVIKEAILQIEYLHNKFQETGTGNAVLSRLKAALEKYKEGK
jgi:uncharacterized protein YllA (UPF0747 family)